MKVLVLCACLRALCVAPSASAGLYGGPWIQRNPPSAISNPTAITFGNGQFVIVGASGAIVTSPDGIIWTPRNSGTTNKLSAVAYGDGQFVAVGGSAIFTSTDGITWAAQNSGTTNSLNAVGHGNGQFVVVGSGGTIVTSADGTAWSGRHSGSTNDLYGVAYGIGQFLAVGNSGTILSSPDEITWNLITNLASRTYFNSVTYGAGRFAITDGGGQVLTSPDTVTWSPQNTGGFFAAITVSSGGGQLVAAGYDAWAYSSGAMATSSNGVTWIAQDVPYAKDLLGVAYGNSRFVAFDQAGRTWSSDDGISWIPPAIASDLFAVAYGHGQFAAVGSAGTILTSPDAVAWSQRQSGTTNVLSTIAGCDSGFAVVWGEPTILTSTDGTSWIPRNAGVTNGFYGIAGGGAHFAAIGQAGMIAYSTDGTNWAAGTLAPNLELIAITHGNGEFLAIANVHGPSGSYGLTLTSPDGGSWQLTPLQTMSWPTNCSIADGAGRFLAGASTPTGVLYLVSMNGITWATNAYSPYYLGSPLAYTDGIFLTPGELPSPRCFPCPTYWGFFASLDGVNWIPMGPGATSPIYGIAAGKSRLVAVGLGGAIFESEDAPEMGPLLLLADGSVQSTISNIADTNCVIQTSIDLTNWVPLTNLVTTTNGTAQFTDPAATSLSQRFYRAVSP